MALKESSVCFAVHAVSSKPCFDYDIMMYDCDLIDDVLYGLIFECRDDMTCCDTCDVSLKRCCMIK